MNNFSSDSNLSMNPGTTVAYDDFTGGGQVIGETVTMANKRDLNSIYKIWIPRDTLFYTIHITAICSLAISILASIGTLIYQQRYTTAKSFWKRRLGERLVIYLAITDLVYSVSHTCDHVLSLIYTGLPPVLPCVIFAFSLLEMILAQNMVIFITAVSLCVSVSCNQKVSFGPYDSWLLVISYGVPAVVCTICAAYGFFGTTGYWCLTDSFKEKSMILHQVLGAIQVLIAVLVILCYSFVWIHISNSSRRLKKFTSGKEKNENQQFGNTNQTCSLSSTSTDIFPEKKTEGSDKDNEEPKSRYTVEPDSTSAKTATEKETIKKAISRHANYKNTAKILTLFVFAYLAQWWPMISVPIWSIFAKPPATYYPVCLFFLNLGGVFNLCAYTVARRLYAKSPNGAA